MANLSFVKTDVERLEDSIVKLDFVLDSKSLKSLEELIYFNCYSKEVIYLEHRYLNPQFYLIDTYIKIYNRKRNGFGRFLFLVFEFLLSFFSIESTYNESNENLNSDYLLNAYSFYEDLREKYIKVYKHLLTKTRGIGRLIDKREFTKRFKFLKTYSGSIDEDNLITRLRIS